MKKNVGNADRIFRFVMAAVIVVLYFTHVITGWLGIGLLIFAGVAVLTGLFRFCPAYCPFKFSSNNCCSNKDDKAKGSCCSDKKDNGEC